MALFKSNKRRFNKPDKVVSTENISISDNYVFIHIPKNAGTSIYQMLNHKASLHYTVKEYINILGLDTYNKMFSFAFVRNPISRFESLYNYARLEESYYHSAINPENALYGKHMDYDKLKDLDINAAVDLLIEGKLEHNPPHVQWHPQINWLTDYNNAINIKYIGRVEDFHLGIRNVMTIIGRPVITSQTKNKSTNSITTKLNKSSIQKLQEYYKLDFELFNY